MAIQLHYKSPLAGLFQVSVWAQDGDGENPNPTNSSNLQNPLIHGLLRCPDRDRTRRGYGNTYRILHVKSKIWDAIQYDTLFILKYPCIIGMMSLNFCIGPSPTLVAKE